MGEAMIGELDGPATGSSLVGEVVLDGIRGSGRIPDDEIDRPLPLPLASGRLPSFREIGSDSRGTGRLDVDVITARGGFLTDELTIGLTFEFSSSSSPPKSYPSA